MSSSESELEGMSMDDELTPSQRVSAAGLRVLRHMNPDIVVVPGVTVEDVERRVLNHEWEQRGVDGVAKVQRAVDEMEGNRG